MQGVYRQELVGISAHAARKQRIAMDNCIAQAPAKITSGPPEHQVKWQRSCVQRHDVRKLWCGANPVSRPKACTSAPLSVSVVTRTRFSEAAHMSSYAPPLMQNSNERGCERKPPKATPSSGAPPTSPPLARPQPRRAGQGHARGQAGAVGRPRSTQTRHAAAQACGPGPKRARTRPGLGVQDTWYTSPGSHTDRSPVSAGSTGNAGAL
eukprot:3959540-Lingulodinium_polyedra.AAC.1